MGRKVTVSVVSDITLSSLSECGWGASTEQVLGIAPGTQSITSSKSPFQGGAGTGWRCTSQSQVLPTGLCFQDLLGALDSRPHLLPSLTPLPTVSITSLSFVPIESNSCPLLIGILP